MTSLTAVGAFKNEAPDGAKKDYAGAQPTASPGPFNGSVV